MQTLLFLLIAVTALVTLGIAIGQGSRGRPAPSALTIGLAVGMIGTLAVLPVSVDVVPDELEPGVIALAILLVSGALAILGLRGAARPRG